MLVVPIALLRSGLQPLASFSQGWLTCSARAMHKQCLILQAVPIALMLLTLEPGVSSKQVYLACSSHTDGITVSGAYRTNEVCPIACSVFG